MTISYYYDPDSKDRLAVSTGSEIFEPYASAMVAYRDLLSVVNDTKSDGIIKVEGDRRMATIRVGHIKSLLDFYVKHMTVNS